MQRNTRPALHGQRGQALFETAWLLPLVLISLVVMCFSARFAVAMENVESAVHYATAVSSTRGTFLRSSLYSLYDGASTGAHRVSQNICYTDGAEQIMKTAGIAFDASTATGRHKMWALPQTTVGCKSGTIVFPAGTFQRALTLNYEMPYVTTSVSGLFGDFGFKLFGSNNDLQNLSSQSSAHLSAVSNRNLVACYAGLRKILQASLTEGSQGTASTSAIGSVTASDLISSAPSGLQPDQADSGTCGG